MTRQTAARCGSERTASLPLDVPPERRSPVCLSGMQFDGYRLFGHDATAGRPTSASEPSTWDDADGGTRNWQ
ncbi:hypothetical protein [Natronorubrum thiooxidans]|uniref:hypothetical protein n=1 Tax=Natronorubrum thiooxidans TaxID=308853 RepID=UPI00118057B6|nr:hypothetical protein [Natronorubrum thiooxidans]